MTGTPLAITGLLVGVVGGIYGLGGGSLLGPMLVGAGLSVARVAPAALASTLVTSTVGVGSYALLSLFTSGSVRLDWIPRSNTLPRQLYYSIADNVPYVRQLVVPLSASRVRQLPRGQASEVSQGWRQIVVVMRSSSWRKRPWCSGDIYACGGGETGEIAQRGHRRPHPGPKALVMHPSTAMSLTASPTMRS
jgi:hypothetical protein